MVGDLHSVHVKNWVTWLCGRGHSMDVISSSYFPSEEFRSARVHNILPPPPVSVIRQNRSLLHAVKRVKGMYRTLLPDTYIAGSAARQIMQLERRVVDEPLALVDEHSATVARLVKEIAPDVVQALRLFPEGMLAAPCDDVPVAIMAWGQDISLYADEYPRVAAKTRDAIARTAGYMADSHRDIDDAHRYGLPRDAPTFVVPSGAGIHTSVAIDVRRPPKALDEPVFMTYRRVGGIFIDNVPIVRAIATLRRRGIGAHFELYGDRGGPYYDRLRVAAKQHGVADAVHVNPPFKDEELPGIIRSSDFVLSAATHDGTSNALLETMWMGGVPICTDLAPTREWITHGHNGYLFDIRDHDSIVGALTQAVNEPDKHNEMRAINQAIIRERASYPECMAGVESLHREILGRS